MLKLLYSSIFILCLFVNNKSHSLNIFELTGIAFGTTFAYGLYFDNSLPYGQTHWFPYSERNIFQKKGDVLKMKRNSFKKENIQIYSRSDLIDYLYKAESLHLKKNILK
tara:strand:+ start:58 stop:384 length:327 start_codon:yes stop_codon:yes gene_type:complete